MKAMIFLPFMHVLVVAILICFKFTFPFVDSAALSIETDKESLISFRSQISLEPPTPLSSWDLNSSPCNWTGIVCNKFGQRVVGIDLSNFGLVGTISPHIGNLTFLRSLQLQGNQLQGIIPAQICNLFRLRVLNMSYNRLEGFTSLNVSKLGELRVLDLMMNNITGRIPEELSLLTNLEVLNLGRNLLWGAIPPSIANISSLKSLNLGTNTLSGVIPGTLSRLRTLQFLDLTINHLSGTVPPPIYNMSSLVQLALASNRLWGNIPPDVGITLPNLLIFNFCINKFTGGIPGSLHNLTNIRIIRMADNLLEGTVPPGLENLPFLTMYNIGKNKISSGDNGLEFITSLTNSTRLSFLAFDWNFLRGPIPDSVGNLSKVLLKLYMGGNNIYGRIPSSIGFLNGLELLDLSSNEISGSIPYDIGRLESLQKLVLARNEISGHIPDSIGNLQKLSQIDLSRNKLVGGIPTTFGSFGGLLSMDLSNNKLNGSIPKEILNLRSLTTILNLSNNFLSGPLSPEIGLQSVVTIDLSTNQLSGNIPSSIQNCLSLEKLYMFKNTFVGPIPASLGEIKPLDTLDLSYNNLSGLIPAELQKLQALQSLNLSNNNLEGAVPSAGVFSNISKVHLEGNPKLCFHQACKNTRGQRRRLVKLYAIIGIMATLALCFSIALLFCVKKRRAKICRSVSWIEKKHKMVSYNELREATGNFNENNLIGNGSFGSVYKGYLRDNAAVAIKVLDIQRTGSLKSFHAECEALRNVRHRNLVKLITSCSSWDSRNKEFLALVYEFLGNGSLEDWLKGTRMKENGDGLNFVERLSTAIDVAGALDYLHNDCEVPVLHCDLKPSNVLLAEDMTAKVGDFGLARLLKQKMVDQHSITSSNSLKGSIGYIPPEYGLGVKPSRAGDVYSFGVMLLEIFTGKSPTDDRFIGEQSLVGWVQSFFLAEVQQVLDPEVLLLMEDDGQPINSKLHHDCLTTILRVGLSCTAGSPDGRISIRDALHKLVAVRSNFLNGTLFCTTKF